MTNIFNTNIRHQRFQIENKNVDHYRFLFYLNKTDNGLRINRNVLFKNELFRPKQLQIIDESC